MGLALGHQYTTLGVKQLTTGERLVKVRNPWGSNRFNGPWSVQSPLWTDAARQETGYAGEADHNKGIFWMTIEDYHANFADTVINYDPEGMHMDYFLSLDEDGTGGYPSPGMPEGTFTADLEITSEVDQTIWITAHTWNNRPLGQSCKY